MSPAVAQEILTGDSSATASDNSSEDSSVSTEPPALSHLNYTKTAVQNLLGSGSIVPCKIVAQGVTAFSTGNFQYLVHQGSRVPFVQCVFCKILLSYKSSSVTGVKGLTKHKLTCKPFQGMEQINKRIP